MTFQVPRDVGLFHRQTLFDQARTVVLKVGSAVLTTEDGLNIDFIDTLCKQIAFLRAGGRQVILVSSGAVAAGRKRLQVHRHPGEELRVKQALAAVGQGLLMHAYEQRFALHNQQQVAQILLTEEDFRDFTFTNAATMWKEANPAFFEGTVVADAVERFQFRHPIEQAPPQGRAEAMGAGPDLFGPRPARELTFRDPVRAESFEADGATTFTLTEVPAGEYALLVHHDADGNGVNDLTVFLPRKIMRCY